MAITKPYTFQAGTKARASEVNQDFDVLYSEVNRIGTEILNIDIDIQNIADGKADINGNAGQIFKMADAVDSYDGVNKNVLENSIANIKDYIGGFIISKDTDTSIIVSPGSCYDSTYAVVINSTGNITKENTIQGAGTRYVHAISDNTGNQTDILISPESISPALPAGYTVYRMIGSYTADGDGNIGIINSYGNDSTVPHGVATIIETYKNGASWYRIWSDGWCEQGGITEAPESTVNTITINLLKSYVNTDYSIKCQRVATTASYSGSSYADLVRSTTNSSFNIYCANDYFRDGSRYSIWTTCGYIN